MGHSVRSQLEIALQLSAVLGKCVMIGWTNGLPLLVSYITLFFCILVDYEGFCFASMIYTIRYKDIYYYIFITIYIYLYFYKVFIIL